MAVDVQRSPTGRVTTVALFGEHDLGTAVEVRRALLDAESALVVLDLAKCTFLDSTVMGVVVTASKRYAARGNSLIVMNAHGMPLRAIEVTALARVLPVYSCPTSPVVRA